MSQINESQAAIYDMLKKGICESIEATLVRKGAIEITTPFIDFKGFPLSIYVTHDGKITDAGSTINQLIALGVYDDFEDWVFQEDFFTQYQIQNVQGRLEPLDPESIEALIAYLQGIARLPNFFEAKPIRSQADTYPTKVKEIAILALMEEKEISLKEAEKFTLPRTLELKKSGLKIQSDLSPKRKTTIVKIISHATSIGTTQKEHVSHKIIEPMLFKEDDINADSCIILNSLSDYLPASQTLIKEKSDILIQTISPNAKQQIAEALAGE